MKNERSFKKMNIDFAKTIEFLIPRMSYSSSSIVRASVVRGPSVVRGFQWLNFSSH